MLALTSKVRYVIDPANEYPRKFTGHLRAILANGKQVEFRQPGMRGGADAPLSQEELEAKFVQNAVFGGWSVSAADRLLSVSRRLFSEPTLEALKEFRALRTNWQDGWRS